MRLRAVAGDVGARYQHAVVGPVVRVEAGRYLVVLRLVAVDADHPFCRVHVGLLGEGKAALDDDAAAGGLMAGHAVLDGRLADGQGRLGAAVLSHDDLPLVVLERLPLPEIVIGRMADQAVDGVFRFGAGAADIAQVIAGVTGVAAGKLGLSGRRAFRDLFQVVHDVVAVAHDVNAVLHAVLFLRVEPIHVADLGGVLPVHRVEKRLGRAGVALLAGLGSLVAALLHRLLARMLACCGCRGCCQGEAKDCRYHACLFHRNSLFCFTFSARA